MCLRLEEARQLLLSDDPAAILEIDGSFALVARQGERVRMARSLDRPLRYFLARVVPWAVIFVPCIFLRRDLPLGHFAIS